MGQFIVAAATAIAANPAVSIAVASTAVSAGVGIRQSQLQKAAGKSQQANLNRQAEQEKIAAIDREGQRRRRLNQILGTTITETGAKGIAFEGSPQAVATAEIEQAELAEAGAKVSDLSKISQLRRTGKAAKRAGKNLSEMTLLSTAAQTAGSAASLGMAMKKPTVISASGPL